MEDIVTAVHTHVRLYLEPGLQLIKRSESVDANDEETQRVSFIFSPHASLTSPKVRLIAASVRRQKASRSGGRPRGEERHLSVCAALALLHLLARTEEPGRGQAGGGRSDERGRGGWAPPAGELSL